MKFRLSLLLLTASQMTSHGAIAIDTNFAHDGTSTLNHGYTPSSSDLINGLLPSTSTGAFDQEASGGLSVLTNGTFPPVTRGQTLDSPGSTGAPFERLNFAATGSSSATYTLASPSMITAINVYGGWQDANRDQQIYRIFYTTSTNSTFTELTGGAYGITGINYNPIGADGNPGATRVLITDDGGPLIADATAIRFDFGATEFGYSGYGEIDVIGSVIPETSSAALLAVAMLGAIRRRR